MILYENAASGNCYKVRLLFAHLGLKYERRSLDVIDRSNRPDILGDLNPALRVPTLILDDGRPLGESGAISWYFGDGTRFVPSDAYERAQVLQWMFFEQYDHEPAIAVARFLIALSGLPREDYEKRLPRLWEQGSKALAAMEGRLAGREWFVGDGMTIADIALYAYTHVAAEGEFDLAPYPAIGDWLARVAAESGHVPIDA
jgi:glutathione S-transferase